MIHKHEKSYTQYGTPRTLKEESYIDVIVPQRTFIDKEGWVTGVVYGSGRSDVITGFELHVTITRGAEPLDARRLVQLAELCIGEEKDGKPAVVDRLTEGWLVLQDTMFGPDKRVASPDTDTVTLCVDLPFFGGRAFPLFQIRMSSVQVRLKLAQTPVEAELFTRARFLNSGIRSFMFNNPDSRVIVLHSKDAEVPCAPTIQIPFTGVAQFLVWTIKRTKPGATDDCPLHSAYVKLNGQMRTVTLPGWYFRTQEPLRALGRTLPKGTYMLHFGHEPLACVDLNLVSATLHLKLNPGLDPSDFSVQLFTRTYNFLTFSYTDARLHWPVGLCGAVVPAPRAPPRPLPIEGCAVQHHVQRMVAIESQDIKGLAQHVQVVIVVFTFK